MRTGSGRAGDPPAAGQQAEPAISSPFATPGGLAGMAISRPGSTGSAG